MSCPPEETGLLLRRFPAHYGAAVLSVVAAAALQTAWPVILAREPASSWWPIDALALVTATGYLLSLADIHWRAACWSTGHSSRLWLLGRTLAADLILVAYGAIVFGSGSQAAVMRAGLSILPPALVATTGISALVSAAALASALARPDRHAAPRATAAGRRSLVHACWGLCLLLLLLLLNVTGPNVKPWDP